MSTKGNTRSSAETNPAADFIAEASRITQSHLRLVEEEIAALFAQMLSTIWLEEGILERSDALAIPRELMAVIRKHFTLDKVQDLGRFYIDFFSGGLAGKSDGQISFTPLEFEGLKLFSQKFSHRIPQGDRTRLTELIRILEKA